MPTSRKHNQTAKAPTPRNARAARKRQPGARKGSPAGFGGFRSSRSGAGHGAQGVRGKQEHGAAGRFAPYDEGGFSTSHARQSPFAQASRSSDPAGRKPAGSGGPVLTRRNLLIGAGVLGGVAVVGGAGALASTSLGEEETPVNAISVPESAVTNLDGLSEVGFADHMRLDASYCLPFGTLVWADSDQVAACLVPTGGTAPLNRLALLYFGSGNAPTVMAKPQGIDQGFDFMEARASAEGLIWTEANVFEGAWRVYTARLADGTVEGVTLADEGTSERDIPSIAACEGRAFWQSCPNKDGSDPKASSWVKAVAYGSDAVESVWETPHAFSTRIAGVGDGVVITPRSDVSSAYSTLVKIQANDLQVADQMTLPSSMRPSLAGYGKTGFSFGFPDIYDYGGGIANLGTYTPLEPHDPFAYDGLPWFRFGRTPSANPSWCKEWMAVKSNRAITLVDLAAKTFFMIDAPSNTDSYGEYLTSTGQRSTVVGTSLVTPPESAVEPEASDANLVSADGKHTLVRVFALL